MNNAQFEPRLKAIPDVPKEFGEDGGQFYRYYDALADELDEDMVKTIKSQLDSILIFAGLFAGVNATFLALTLPELRADPADDTNALLLQLVTGGNSTIQSADDLPSATFTPSSAIILVNLLFSLSAVLAVTTSFFAAMAQHWLIDYRSRSDGSAECQRWERIRRHLGATKWQLKWVLDDGFPALLQSAVMIFSLAIIIYLRTLNKTICSLVVTVIAIALEIAVFMNFMAGRDKWCPYKCTLARFLGSMFENPGKYGPIAPVVFLVQYTACIPIIIAVSVPASIIASYLRLKDKLGIYFGYSPLPMQADGLAATRPLQKLWSFLKVVPRLGKGYVLPGKPAALLKAVAVKRVLRASEDFNALIYTAVNIQAMDSMEGAQYLLEDDTVHERLEELKGSSDGMLASAFTCAFSHLLLGGHSAELFVKQEHRGIYPSWNVISQTYQYCETPYPLKERVQFICDRLNAITQSPDIHQDTFVESLHYFELLELILDETSGIRELSKWSGRIIQKQQPAKVSTPLVISLVAEAVRISIEGIESAEASSELQISRSDADLERDGKERPRPDGEHLFTVQHQRIQVVKKLIGTVGWEMKLVPSDPSESRRKSALGLIEDAFFTDDSQSLRHPDKTDLWLLEQALLISTSNRHEPGWRFVAMSSVGLLLSFNNREYPTPDSIGTQDIQKDNRRRCAKILSQCIQAIRDHLGPDEFIQTVSPALDKLVDYWARFKDDFTRNPDLNDSDMLSSWFGIRGALERPEESGWGPLHQQQFGQAYPSLKAGFDAIAASMFDIAPRVDRDLTVLPPVATFNKQAGRAELDHATPTGATSKPDENFDHPLEDTNEDAREPT